MNNPYPINRKLSVIPTGNESQFEAFQSIIAYIMSASIDQKNVTPQNMSPYELLCKIHKITLTVKKPTKPQMKNKLFIVFKGKKITHYIAYVNGKPRNPYKFYQAKDTQGFCQMFAFFLCVSGKKKKSSNSSYRNYTYSCWRR